MPSHRNVLIVSEKVAVQLCRLLRPRDSCAKCGCCASPCGVTHLREKKGSPRWAKIPASRKYEKTRARSSYRKRTSRYASRARATARCARRALHPTKQSKIHFCRDPSGGAIGRRTQNKRLLRLERNRRPRNTRCAANQQPSCNTIDFRHWKARTPPPKIAVAHFLRACGVAQRSDFARMREETVNAHDSQHCGRWENI